MFICCGFAATNASWNDEVKVTAKVGVVTVSDAAEDAATKGTTLYGLFGGLDSYAMANDKLIDSQKDISEEDISVYFRIHQNSKVKTQETINLTVTAGPMFLNGITSGTVDSKTATNLPVISNIQGNPLTGAYTVGSSVGASTNSFTFTVAYVDRTVSVDNRDIGYFMAKWGHVDNLQDGTYSASITMILETN